MGRFGRHINGFKLGISFNLWKGEEFIPYCLNQIKPFAGYVVIIYQQKSNYGQERDDISNKLDKWVNQGLIDEWVNYDPDFDCEPQYYGIHNELRKRNIALEKCKEAGCTHISDLDADEIYYFDDFDMVLDEIVFGNYDAGFCKMKTYYKYPDCQLEEIENYYVPFIYKINKDSKFEPIENDMFPVLTDGKRRIKHKNPLILDTDELVMHHYSYVRKDDQEMIDKFKNASSRLNFTDERINEIIKCWNSFKVGNKALFGKDQEVKTIKADNLFKIEL